MESKYSYWNYSPIIEKYTYTNKIMHNYVKGDMGHDRKLDISGDYSF